MRFPPGVAQDSEYSTKGLSLRGCPFDSAPTRQGPVTGEIIKLLICRKLSLANIATFKYKIATKQVIIFFVNILASLKNL